MFFFFKETSSRLTKICLLDENEKIEFINEINEKYIIDGITEKDVKEKIKEIKSEYYKKNEAGQH